MPLYPHPRDTDQLSPPASRKYTYVWWANISTVTGFRVGSTPFLVETVELRHDGGATLNFNIAATMTKT
jgi:hypothetical protein